MKGNPFKNIRSQKIVSVAEEMVQQGCLTPDQLAVALESQKNLGSDLGDILVRRGFLTADELKKRLAQMAGIKAVSLSEKKPEKQIVDIISPAQAQRWNVVPLDQEGEKLILATADPFDLKTLEEVSVTLGRKVDYVLVTPDEIEDFIKVNYSLKKEPAGAQVIQELASGLGVENAIRGRFPSQKPQEADGSKTVMLVNEIFEKAITDKASDIHFDPVRDGLNVRARIDGMLEPIRSFPLSMQQTILSRIKILGSMDVAEHRVPQDGRARLHVAGQELDIRISTFPTIHGEASAIRLLSRDNLLTLDDLGFLGNDRDIFEKLILKPWGLFLVTGPTGSGKTTTLYAALQRIDRTKHRVLTVEDPVENEIEGANQTQVNVKAGVTFPVVVRAMLREDPDIIMVGEIRDQETAEIGVRAAMTGHLVLSTLHTNDAIGAIARLHDLGLEKFLISSTLVGAMAQRLVRRICPACKMEATIAPELLKKLGPKGAGLKAFVGRGCSECKMRGFKGRIGLFELVSIDDEFRVLINNDSPEVRLKEKAAASGTRSIFDDGIEKVRQGITTIDEVFRVCGVG